MVLSAALFALPRAFGVQPLERALLYSFETLDRGNNSGFGQHCGSGSDAAAAVADAGSIQGARSIIRLPLPRVGPCYARVAVTAFEAVIRGECAWLDFWREHSWDQAFDPAPFVDFSRYVVVVVIEGPRSGCTGIEIEGISGAQGSDLRRIHVRKEVNCAGIDCQALSNAYHIVLVPREFLALEAAVAFVHDEPLPEGLEVRRP